MQQKMITQKRTQAECRPRYQEVAVDHTAVSDMKYKQMNRAVLTEFLSYSSLKRSKEEQYGVFDNDDQGTEKHCTDRT